MNQDSFLALFPGIVGAIAFAAIVWFVWRRWRTRQKVETIKKELPLGATGANAVKEREHSYIVGGVVVKKREEPK